MLGGAVGAFLPSHDLPRRLDLLVHEILLKQGKGLPTSSSPFFHPPSYDIKTRGGHRTTRALHMPALKVVHVQEMDAWLETHALLTNGVWARGEKEGAKCENATT